MIEPVIPAGRTIPAVFRYGAFYDLLADAVFQHVRAAEATAPYVTSRFARASVLASALSVECVANSFLAAQNLPKALGEEIDRLSPLGKIDLCLRLRGCASIERGNKEAQAIAELIKARNDYVHPKSIPIRTEIRGVEDGGADWLLPLSLEGENWPQLGIPKRAMFWTSDSSLAALGAVAGFYRHLFQVLLAGEGQDIHMFLGSRLEVGEARVMAVSDEIRLELKNALGFGVDFGFLGLFASGSSANQ